MDDAQVWTALAIMAGAFASMISLTLVTVTRTFGALSTRIDAMGERLDGRIDALGHTLGARIDAVETGLTARIDAVESGLEARLGGRIDALAVKVDHLDRDVQRLAEHVFPTDR